MGEAALEQDHRRFRGFCC